LLVAGGASKLRRPDPGARALVAVGVAGGSAAARLVGAIELCVGTAALLAPGAGTAGPVAFVYLLFAAFVAAVAAGRLPTTSCGCLGQQEIPASWLHVTLDLVAAVVALLAALWPPRSLLSIIRGLPLAGVPAITGVALIGYLSYLAVSYVPELFFSYRRPARTIARAEGARE
jgi:hypothetical protein